jgi:phage terminase large subunit-like protein
MAGDAERRIALVSKTPGDARDDMIEGLGGILKNAPPDERPEYEPSKRRLTWPTGAWATIYSGAHPEQVRGFSGDTAWLDELAAWQYPKETWDNLVLGMREAKVSSPKLLVTTTPRPIPLIRKLKKRCEDRPDQWRFVKESTYANQVNLDPVYYAEVIEPLEQTDLGRQEIYAEILEQVEGALWRREWIDETRMGYDDPLPDMVKVVVGVDPAGSAEEESSETGIVVGGRDRHRHGYMMADASLRATPERWARTAVNAYHEYHAHSIVAEKNYGGDMVRATIHAVDPDVPVRLITASRGKRPRAEPVAAKSQLGLIHHVGVFGPLEDQLCTWTIDDDSPDRLDAYVHCFTDLLVTGQRSQKVEVVSIGQDNPFAID